MKFYEPLKHLPNGQDSLYYTSMATCYEASGLYKEAVECYQAALAHNSANTDAQAQLAVLCQELGIPNLAPVEANDDISARDPARQQPKKSNRLIVGGELGEALTVKRSPLAMIAPRPSFRNLKKTTIERIIRKKAEERDSYALFSRMETLADQARDGDPDSRAQWMSAAKQMIEIFQSERAFFPYEKYMRFYGYTKEARKKSLNSKLIIGSREDLTITARDGSCSGESTRRQLTESLMKRTGLDNDPIPDEFRAIKFQSWLDIFLEYALTLAKCGRIQAAYAAIISASNANVFYHSSQRMFLIHVCWFSQ